jgi:hypothetical protein
VIQDPPDIESMVNDLLDAVDRGDVTMDEARPALERARARLVPTPVLNPPNGDMFDTSALWVPDETKPSTLPPGFKNQAAYDEWQAVKGPDTQSFLSRNIYDPAKSAAQAALNTSAALVALPQRIADVGLNLQNTEAIPAQYEESPFRTASEKIKEAAPTPDDPQSFQSVLGAMGGTIAMALPAALAGGPAGVGVMFGGSGLSEGIEEAQAHPEASQAKQTAFAVGKGILGAFMGAGPAGTAGRLAAESVLKEMGQAGVTMLVIGVGDHVNRIATVDPNAKFDLDAIVKQTAAAVLASGAMMGLRGPKKETASEIQNQPGQQDPLKQEPVIQQEVTPEQAVPVKQQPPDIAPKFPQEPPDTGPVKAESIVKAADSTEADLVHIVEEPATQDPGVGMKGEGWTSKPGEGFYKKPPTTPEAKVEAPVTEDGFQTSTKNAVTEAERTIRDAAPIEAEASRDFGTVWDEAKAASPEEGRALVDELAQKHRPVNDRENALILRRKIEVRNAFEDNAKAMQAAKESGDTETLQRTKQQNAVLLDELDKIDIVNKNVGRESGRGLNARKMEAKNDMTLAAVMTRMSAENGYEPLPAETQARITKLVAEREAAYAELNKLRSEMDARLSKAEADIAAIGSAPAAKGKLLDFFDKRGDEAMARLKKRLASPSANIFLDPEVISDLALVAAKHIAHGVDAAAQLVKDFGEEIRPHLDDIVQRARSLHDEQLRKATPMERREKAAERTIGRKQEMLKTGDVMPKKRTVEPPSRRLLELQAESARYDKLIEHERMKIRKANMSKPEKAADILTRWNRAWILSSPAVFGKLAAASAWRLGFMPIREGIGAAISKAVPDIASKAHIEGGSSVEALAKGYSMAFKNAVGDAWKTLKEGGTQMDQAFGKKHIVPTEGVEFIGAMHGAMKAPLKRASFEYGLQKGYEGAIREGLDVNDPMVQMRVGMEAYKFAERQLFLQDNAVVKALKAFNAILRKQGGGVGKSTATTIDLMTPVVKIPTNIIAESFEHIFGSVTGSVEAAKAYRKGIEKLSRDDAESIMRQLKNGAHGFAAMTLGWALYKNLGGQYDRSDKKMQPGTANVFGVTVPASALHLPFHEVMMAAATARKYAEKRNKDIDDGVLKAMLGLVEEIPLARETVEVGRILSGEKDPRDILGQRLVPQGVKDVAKWTDSATDREAHGFVEQFKKGVPGLRQQLRPKR